jgi:hypothetical protein
LPGVGGDLWHLVRANRRDTGVELRPEIGDLSPRGERSPPQGLPRASICSASGGSGEVQLRHLQVGESHVS